MKTNDKFFYLLTPLYDINPFKYHHEREIFGYLYSTEFIFFSGRGRSEYEKIAEYFYNEGVTLTKNIDIIIESIIEDDDYISWPECIAITKCTRISDEIRDYSSVYARALFISLLLSGKAFKFSKHFRISIQNKKDDNFEYQDVFYSGYNHSMRITNFNKNLKSSRKNQFNPDEIFEWIINIENIADDTKITQITTLALDYFLHTYKIDDSRVAYINLVMVIEVLFKLHHSDTSSEIGPRLATFLAGSDTHRKKYIRRKFHGKEDSISDMRNTIIHGDLIDRSQISDNYSLLFDFVREVLVKILEEVNDLEKSQDDYITFIEALLKKNNIV